MLRTALIGMSIDPRMPVPAAALNKAFWFWNVGKFPICLDRYTMCMYELSCMPRLIRVNSSHATGVWFHFERENFNKEPDQHCEILKPNTTANCGNSTFKFIKILLVPRESSFSKIPSKSLLIPTFSNFYEFQKGILEGKKRNKSKRIMIRDISFKRNGEKSAFKKL